MVIDFLEANRLHQEQLKLGFLENLDGGKINEYESIYKQHMDARFMVCKWCKGDIYMMVTRVWNWYENQNK